MVLNEISSVGFIAIVLIVFLLFPAVSASSAESENLLAEGVDMYNSGDRDAALQLFELLIHIDPSWPYGWLWKGTKTLRSRANDGRRYHFVHARDARRFAPARIDRSFQRATSLSWSSFRRNGH